MVSLLRIFELWRFPVLTESSLSRARPQSFASAAMAIWVAFSLSSVRLCQLVHKALLDLEFLPCLCDFFGHCSDLAEVIGFRINSLLS